MGQGHWTQFEGSIRENTNAKVLHRQEMYQLSPLKINTKVTYYLAIASSSWLSVSTDTSITRLDKNLWLKHNFQFDLSADAVTFEYRSTSWNIGSNM